MAAVRKEELCRQLESLREKASAHLGGLLSAYQKPAGEDCIENMRQNSDSFNKHKEAEENILHLLGDYDCGFDN
ncbi:MAG: hypothetical protein K0T99_03830 [Alphaproteobacteria bacterium]|nr:hypothetical protein [Alphaproteobacteria bacterium]